MLFRPERNARRFPDSAERLAMPILPENLFLKAIEELVKIDAAWIPGGGSSLFCARSCSPTRLSWACARPPNICSS